MRVEEIMTKNVAVCMPSTTISECAKLMLDNDCGEIPVVDEEGTIAGVITDRDITCRVVAKGEDPTTAEVSHYMTKGVTTIKKEDDIQLCQQLMSDNQVRRLPVVDDEMHCIGIVSQAHIARKSSRQEAGNLAKSLSETRH